MKILFVLLVGFGGVICILTGHPVGVIAGIILLYGAYKVMSS